VRAISQFPYKRIVWLLPLVLAIHEIEEWNIKAWNVANFQNAPETPESAIRALLVLVILSGFAVAALACAFKNDSKTAYVSLTFFVFVAFNNSLQHIYWQLAWGTYAPGVIAAAFLNIPAILLVSWHAIKNRLVSPIYLFILYASGIVALNFTHTQGHSFPEVMKKGHEFGVQIVNYF